MYELDYLSAANASVDDVVETLAQIIDIMEASLKSYEEIPDEQKTEETYEAINKYKEIIEYVGGNLNVAIPIDKVKPEGIQFKHIENLMRKSKTLGVPLNVYITGYNNFGNEKEHIEMLFSPEQMNAMFALNHFLVDNGYDELKFMEYPEKIQYNWTFSQVVKANLTIDEVVNTVKLYNFSPFETVAYIHNFISTQFPYQENKEDAIIPRSIVGIFNSQDIVCVGYAKFFKAIVDRLNMPGLEAFTVESVIKPIPPANKVKVLYTYPIQGFGHLQNMIKIDDPKYQIKGSYMDDSCWDCVSESYPDGKGFGLFMFPIKDLLHLRGQSYIEVDKTNDYDLGRRLYSVDKADPLDTPLFKEHLKQSKPIPIEKYRECFHTLYRKSFPSLTKKEVNEIIDEIMRLSESVAASIFDDKATGSIAKKGLENIKDTMVDTKEIIR